MSEQEREPMLLVIMRAVWRVLSPLFWIIGPKTFWYIFRAITYTLGGLLGYKVNDVPGHPFRLEFFKEKPSGQR